MRTRQLPNDVSEIKLDLKIDWDKLGDYRPSWNAPPTSNLPVVTSAQRVRTLETMRWGLIPSWAKDARSRVRPSTRARRASIRRRPSAAPGGPAAAAS